MKEYPEKRTIAWIDDETGLQVAECMYVREDIIEELEERLKAATDDAKKAEAYAEELEAKLLEAEWLLADAAVQLEQGKINTRRNRAALIRQFLAELKGGDE